MKDSDTGIIIKTGNEIEHEIYTAIEARQQDYVDRLLKSRWAHIDSLQKKIEKEKQFYPMDTSSNCIENASANDVLRWLLSLISEERKCRNCGQPGLINPETLICDNCYFNKELNEI